MNGFATDLLFLRFVRKNFIERHLELPGNLESQFKGGRIFAIFNGHDGLTGYTRSVSQFLLGHFIVVKTELADVVVDITLRHDYTPLR